MSAARLRTSEPKPEASSTPAAAAARAVAAPAGCRPTQRRHAEDEARRAFIRAVSHELRTPLNAIIGFSEIIAQELHGPIGEPRYKAHAQLVRDSGLKLLKLVNLTLEIARLESGAWDMDLRPESTALAFAEAAQATAEAFAARRIRLETRIETGAEEVTADNRGLNTVLVNLLHNAAEFSPSGETVSLTARPSAGDVCIEVEDRGPGLSPADLNRLLQPFQHNERTPQRGGDGHGLGLAVVNLTCKAMGGQMRLQSSSGRGLISSVRLPKG